MCSLKIGPASPTVIVTEVARQRCPAQPKDESAMMRVAISISASGKTTTGFLAPPAHWARFPLAAALLYTYLATGEEPTKEIARTSGWSSKASTTPLAPFTRLITPGGRLNSSIRSKTRLIVIGTFSEGLTMKQLPQAIA